MDSYRKAQPQKKASSRPGTGKESFPQKKTKSSAGQEKAFRDKKTDTEVRQQREKSIQREQEGSETGKNRSSLCPVWKKCGGCDYQGLSYEEQLQRKNRLVRKLLGDLVEQIHPVIGMESPLHYRCKVHAVFSHDRKGNPVSGIYEKDSHRVVPVDSCMIEDSRSDEIIVSIRDMLRSFRIRTYDEDTGFGLLRHVLVRKGFATNQYMVVLVTVDPVFPSKNNFVKALRQKYPEISTVVLNINSQNTSMVLGERNIVLHGPGYIEDELCGCRFRISPNSFYQVNPVQTEILYRKAIEYAHLTGKEEVLDAYCGTGTIGIIASSGARKVTGVELNPDAIRDAVVNAKRNQRSNIRFIRADATEYMENAEEIRPDIVIMDPPRSGSTERFIRAVGNLRPERVVYVSCDPQTLARDLRYFRKVHYRAVEAQPVDLFPFTGHVETVCLLTHKG